MNEINLGVESLEDRVLLSGSAVTQGADLVVTGTSASDLIEVRQIGTQLRVLVKL